MADRYAVASRFDWPVILLRCAWQLNGEDSIRSSLLCEGSSGVDSDFSGGAGSFETSMRMLEIASDVMGLPHALSPRSVCEPCQQ